MEPGSTEKILYVYIQNLYEKIYLVVFLSGQAPFKSYLRIFIDYF